MSQETFIVKDKFEDVIKMANHLGFEIKEVDNYEYHLLLDDVLAFRVWKGKKQNWVCQLYNEFHGGYTRLITELGIYYLNNKEV